MDQVDPRQRMWWQPRQQLSGIAGEEPDVADVMRLDLCQDLRHAVDVRLATDEADFGEGTRFRDQVFAAAESDFEPDFIGPRIEQVSEIGRAGAGDVERKSRQQMFDQIGLMRAELVALAPPEQCTARLRGDPIVGRRIAFRSIAGCNTYRSI